MAEERKFNVSDLNEELSQISSADVAEQVKKEDATFDDNQVFEWDSYEFEYHQKGNKWFWGVVAVAVVMLIIFGVMRNWMGMVLAVVCAILIYQYAYKQPRKLHYVLTKDGLVIDDKSYQYDQMVSYWLTQEGVIYLNTKWWPPRLSIEVNSVDIEALDRFLQHYVKKVERDEADTADSFSRWIKF